MKNKKAQLASFCAGKCCLPPGAGEPPSMSPGAGSASPGACWPRQRSSRHRPCPGAATGTVTETLAFQRFPTCTFFFLSRVTFRPGTFPGKGLGTLCPAAHPHGAQGSPCTSASPDMLPAHSTGAVSCAPWPGPRLLHVQLHCVARSPFLSSPCRLGFWFC